jgi:alcohol dehydrogenase, propanol-preferring
MEAWRVVRPGPIDDHPLEFSQLPVPQPRPGELLVRVRCCGICRTDLHIAEGDLPQRAPNIVPGHQIVGVVEAIGEGASRFRIGDRIGIAWLRYTCERCRFCSRGLENLCKEARFTGWDVDGGYAEYAVADERYAYGLPDAFSDERAAPLLCAGIIGYRALRRSRLPSGGSLGIYGFGASAHITAQIALHEGAIVHVATRSRSAQELALELGVASVGKPLDRPPARLDAAILFAPAGELVPIALEALAPGGILSIAGIHLSSIPQLDYARHLFDERGVVSVKANTREDGEAFLDLAAHVPVEVTTTAFDLSEADTALTALARGEISGIGVVRVSE